MADFTRQNPGLNDALPPSGLGKHEPARLEEVVSLTHPFLGPLVRFRDVEISSQFAVGATNVASPVVPAGEVWYVEAAHVQQADAAQHMDLELVNFALGATVTLRNTRQDGGGAVWPAVFLWPGLTRPILIPPGFQLRAVREVGGVGNIVLTFMLVRLKLAEVPPSI